MSPQDIFNLNFYKKEFFDIKLDDIYIDDFEQNGNFIVFYGEINDSNVKITFENSVLKEIFYDYN